MNTSIIKALNWRYAVKEFDPKKKVSDEDFSEILEAARLSPSSYGLQPWKFIVVNDPGLRKQIRAAAWDQTKVTEASKLIVLTVNKKVNAEYVDHYIAAIAKERGITAESLKGFADMIKGDIAGRSAEGVLAWSSRQVYIPLGIILETAALKNIDACPMEGFDPKKVDEILGLNRLGLGSIAMVAVGYRSDKDTAAKDKKVRFCKEEVVTEM